MEYVLDGALGLLIGLVLGLLGGGGSILTVPALVYIVGQPPQAAVTASLMIVGSNSMTGAFFHRSQGTLNWRIALVFGGAGMLLAYFAAGLSKYFSGELLMTLFAILMFSVGLLMIFRQVPAQTEMQSRSWPIIIASGAVVGLLTGFLGVGGGFLIVPALVMLVGLPMPQAVGTSLIVIAMNSVAGLLGHLGGVALDWDVILIFALAGILGTYLGTQLSQFIQPDKLRRLFAVFIIVLAFVLLMDNLL